MKNSIFLMAFLMVGLWTLAQDQQSASATLRELKHGSLIVRLKTNQKSVDAYRRAGKQQIAQRIEEERRSQNQRIYWAFKGYFRFCKVYFIYAYETMNFLKGTPGLLLNQNLDPDSSIIFSDSSFVFCEYGSAQPFADFEANLLRTVLRINS
ncbi:MAG: hypothetical protein IPP77_00420 [Bacteroidetes bacterium]|nr:hypothetical protein [Bacteroidota bacterium]